MDLLAITRKFWRYKLLTVPVVVLTLWGAVYVMAVKQPVYEATSSYVLLNPPAPPTAEDIVRDPALARVKSDNPYTRFGDQSVILAVLASTMSGDSARRGTRQGGSGQPLHGCSQHGVRLLEPDRPGHRRRRRPGDGNADGEDRGRRGHERARPDAGGARGRRALSHQGATGGQTRRGAVAGVRQAPDARRRTAARRGGAVHRRLGGRCRRHAEARSAGPWPRWLDQLEDRWPRLTRVEAGEPCGSRSRAAWERGTTSDPISSQRPRARRPSRTSTEPREIRLMSRG